MSEQRYRSDGVHAVNMWATWTSSLQSQLLFLLFSCLNIGK